MVAGAVSAGMTHYAGTAKALKEEGIEPAARLRAFPTAVRILCRPGHPAYITF